MAADKRDTCGITPEMIGVDGRVCVWDRFARAWVRKAPIDAVEMLRAGAGSLEGDEAKPAEPVYVNPKPEVPFSGVKQASPPPPPASGSTGRTGLGFPEPVSTAKAASATK